MENGEPDKQALERIKETEQALSARHEAAQKAARGAVARAREQAERIVRKKEDDLAQARRLEETSIPQMESSETDTLSGAPLDDAARKAAEKIAQSLFIRITSNDSEGAK